ncbi:MAG: AfsA-related hotdog domain-containing protein [Gammaproteobacteria bacterium]
MKENEILYIVGDKFESFAHHKCVFTFSKFIKFICNDKSKFNCDFVMLGQGLNEEEKNILKSLAVNAGVTCIQESFSPLASSNISHKCKIENIMISDPSCAESNDLYKSHLYLNDDCAEMSDHVTGQHIQGMVFTEAARQMMLAVAEKYILNENDKENSYCALLKVNSQFYQFGFPIATEILHKVNELECNKTGRYKAKTTTEFIQNGKVIAMVDIDYIFNDKNILSKKEVDMAESALNEHIFQQLEKMRLPLVG